MLTTADIRNKVNHFPKDRSVEELLDQLVVLYKIEKGWKEAEEGKAISFEFEKETELWWKSK